MVIALTTSCSSRKVKLAKMLLKGRSHKEEHHDEPEMNDPKGAHPTPSKEALRPGQAQREDQGLHGQKARMQKRVLIGMSLVAIYKRGGVNSGDRDRHRHARTLSRRTRFFHPTMCGDETYNAFSDYLPKKFAVLKLIRMFP